MVDRDSPDNALHLDLTEQQPALRLRSDTGLPSDLTYCLLHSALYQLLFKKFKYHTMIHRFLRKGESGSFSQFFVAQINFKNRNHLNADAAAACFVNSDTFSF